MEDELVTVSRAARLMGLSRAQMYNWVKQGRVRAYRLPTGKYRIPLSELERLINESNPEQERFYFHRPERKSGE